MESAPNALKGSIPNCTNRSEELSIRKESWPTTMCPAGLKSTKSASCSNISHCPAETLLKERSAQIESASFDLSQ